MKYSLVILSVIVATVSAGVVQSSRNPLIELPKYSIQPHLSGEGRITNGNIATPGQFPYQAGLFIIVEDGVYFCGGILISNRNVLTAAHCLDKAEKVIVILGAQNITDNEENQLIVNVTKSSVTIHEKWDEANLKNDIALITLNEPLTFTDYIQPATLPSKNSTSNYVGSSVVASGWGLTSDWATFISDELRFIVAKVLKNVVCNVLYLGSVTNDMICIETIFGKSTCNGDSGGPLVHKENGKNILVGITSFGIFLGCEKYWPAVFTRITSYLDWIEQHSGVVNNG